MLNGSPHESGVNDLALREMEAIFQENGIETEIVQVGNLAIRGCTACGACTKLGKCVYDDIVNELAPKFKEADGLVVSSPVYYASANATLIAVLDRLFYSTCFDKTMKVGASVVSCRRGGASATFDELNKYTYYDIRHVCNVWNQVVGERKSHKKVQLTQEEKGERDRCFNEYRTLSGYLARIEHFALA